jgi:hypothetical protein
LALSIDAGSMTFAPLVWPLLALLLEPLVPPLLPPLDELSLPHAATNPLHAIARQAATVVRRLDT